MKGVSKGKANECFPLIILVQLTYELLLEAKTVERNPGFLLLKLLKTKLNEISEALRQLKCFLPNVACKI